MLISYLHLPLTLAFPAAVAGMSGCTGQSDVFRNTLEAGDDCSNWSGSDEAVVKSICGSAWLTLYPYNGTFAFINGAGDQSSCQIIRTQLPDHNPVYLGAKCALIPGRSISEHDWFY